MGTATINGELWGARAEPWSRIQEGHVLPLYEAVFEAVGLTSGTALLDAGCGSGLALQLATERGAVGTGLDASAALIDIARRRAPSADLRVGELEDLPYTEDRFDVATAFNSVQYAGDYPDVETALRGQESPGVLVMAARHAGEQVVAEAIRGSLGQFVRADGSVRIANTFRFIVARTGGPSHV
jgi:SAM-dependent methyltransferase